VTGGFNRNIIVLLEVDTGLLLAGVIEDTEELTLNTGVCGSSNVFAIAPLSVATTTS
jgi:hypothetical protein